jgi:hypothetical protein
MACAGCAVAVKPIAPASATRPRFKALNVFMGSLLQDLPTASTIDAAVRRLAMG